MNVTVCIPDDLAQRLTASGADLERHSLEVLVLEEFRAGRMTKGELRRALGFEVLDEVDGFHAAHNVYEPVTIEDVRRDVETLARLGF